MRFRKSTTVAGALALACWVLGADAAWASVRSQALYARGLVPFHRGYWDEAYELFNQAVAADEDDSAALYYRGLAQARRGLRAQAIGDLERALKLDKSLSQAALDLGVAHFDEGNFEKAVPWLNQAYNQGTDKLSAALFLGISYYRLEDYSNSLKYLEEAKADPELRQAALYYGGLALMRLGHANQAQTALAEALRENPRSEMGKAAGRAAASDSPEAAAANALAPASAGLRMSAGSGFEYDSNVNIGATNGTLATDSQADGRYVFSAGGSGTLLSTDWGELSASASLSQSVHFSLTEFDLTATRARLEWTDRPGWWAYGASAGYDFNALNYQSFFQDAIVSPWAAVYETRQLATQGYYTFRYRDFFRGPYDPFRDGINNAFGIRQYLLLPEGGTLLHAGYQFDSELPEDRNSGDPYVKAGAQDFEAMGHQFDLQASTEIGLPNGVPVLGSAGYRFRFEDYQNDNSRGRPGNADPREDFENLFALRVGHDLSAYSEALARITRRTVLSVSFILDTNSSNYDEFEYDRFIGQVGLDAQF